MSVPKVTHKPWGFAFHDRDGAENGVKVDYLFVAPGGYCSIHRHERATHEIRVIYGELFIETFDDPGAGVGVIHRFPGPDELETKPGQWHRFRAGPGGAVALEFYKDWSEGDIERLTEGGVA